MYYYILDMKQLSKRVIEQRIQARIRKLGECGISISGSFTRTYRTCGKANCQCAREDGEKHLACQLTSKVNGKTKAVYVPVGLNEEVERWVNERRKIKQLLKEIDEYAEMLIRQHSRRSRAVRANEKRAKSTPRSSSRSS
jgi:hypothetical protein